MTTRKTTTSTNTTTPKATTRKPTVKKATQTEEVELIQEEVVEEVAPQPKRQVKAEPINQNELIPCRTTQKNLIYVSKRTSERIQWEEFGETQYVAFGELVAMKGAQPRFFKDAWIIIDDEEAVNQLGLAKQYADMFDIEDLEAFFDLKLDKMEEILSKMPNGFKKTIANEAGGRVKEGTLDSRNTIRLLEKYLDVDLKIFE